MLQFHQLGLGVGEPEQRLLVELIEELLLGLGLLVEDGLQLRDLLLVGVLLLLGLLFGFASHSFPPTTGLFPGTRSSAIYLLQVPYLATYIGTLWKRATHNKEYTLSTQPFAISANFTGYLPQSIFL